MQKTQDVSLQMYLQWTLFLKKPHNFMLYYFHLIFSINNNIESIVFFNIFSFEVCHLRCMKCVNSNPLSLTKTPFHQWLHLVPAKKVLKVNISALWCQYINIYGGKLFFPPELNFCPAFICPCQHRIRMEQSQVHPGVPVTLQLPLRTPLQDSRRTKWNIFDVVFLYHTRI